MLPSEPFTPCTTFHTLHDPVSNSSPTPLPRREQITEIVRLRSQRLILRMAEKRMALELQDSAVEFLASVG